MRGGGGAQLRGGGSGEKEGQEEVVGSHNRSEELISMQRGGDDGREERSEYAGEPSKHFFGSGEGGVEVSSKIRSLFKSSLTTLLCQINPAFASLDDLDLLIMS